MANSSNISKKRVSKKASEPGTSFDILSDLVLHRADGSIALVQAKTSGSKAKRGAQSGAMQDQRQIQTPRGDMVIVRIGGEVATKTAPADQKAKFLLVKFGRALSKPGVSRTEVFGAGKSAKTVYAYSLDPKDPTMIIREDAQGKRAHGKVVDGTFKSVGTVRG